MTNYHEAIKRWVCRLYTDRRLTKIIKARTPSVCRYCECKINANDYCFGNHYNRICIACMEKMLPEIIAERKEDLKKAEEKFNSILDNLKQNKDTYNKNNMVNTIE